MQVIGTRFSTWVGSFNGADHVWKAMDVSLPNRKPSSCFRELLGFRLGSRLGLAVPATRLVYDERYGRVSVQRVIAGARSPTPGEQHALATSRTGLRILLLDLLCRNHDRRPANLLVV